MQTDWTNAAIVQKFLRIEKDLIFPLTINCGSKDPISLRGTNIPIKKTGALRKLRIQAKVRFGLIIFSASFVSDPFAILSMKFLGTCVQSESGILLQILESVSSVRYS